MSPIAKVTNSVENEKIEIAIPEKDRVFRCTRTINLAGDIFEKYPLNSTVTTLYSALEIKQYWLYNEWSQHCQFSNYIVPHFPDRCALDPKNPSPDLELIQSIFYKVRGQYRLWQDPREKASWKKIEVPHLKLDWVIQNVEILFPQENQFEVSELKGIVLWKNKESQSGKRYELYEGNHRISAWINAGTPETLPAPSIIFIGKQKVTL